MGQYHIIVNLDKKEFIHPHKLGDGLKLLEQMNSHGGTMAALFALLACSNGRGGGDIPDGIEYRLDEKKKQLKSSRTRNTAVWQRNTSDGGPVTGLPS